MRRPAVRNILLGIGLIWVSGNSFSQNPEWMYWDPWTCTIPSRFLSGIEVDADNNKWIGTEPVCGGGICTDGGLAVFDGYTWQVYDSLNSTLNSNFIGSLHIDANNVVWAGTKFGEVSSYDGNWSSHPFPTSANVPVISLASDLYGNIWAGTEGNGLFKFDGSGWEHFYSGNSQVPDYLNCTEVGPDNSVWVGGAINKLYKYTGDWDVIDIPSEVYFVSSIGINFENNIWIGSDGIFCNFFAGNWTVYDESITGIPDTAIGYIFDIEFDYSGNTWIGHSKGLIKYDGSNWTTYAPENSGLLSRHIQSLAADELGNLWIGTADTGLIAYQPGGVVTIDEFRVPSAECRIQNLVIYPNPSTSPIQIQFDLMLDSYIEIFIYDSKGNEIKKLVQKTLIKGKHEMVWDHNKRGLYFIYMKAEEECHTTKLIVQ